MSASLSRLQSFYSELKPALLLHAVIKREFPSTLAVLTSFAADAGLLLSMVAEIDPAIPILYADDDSRPETREYGKTLCTSLGLSQVHRIGSPLAHILDTMGILALVTGFHEVSLPRIGLDEGGFSASIPSPDGQDRK